MCVCVEGMEEGRGARATRDKEPGKLILRRGWEGGRETHEYEIAKMYLNRSASKRQERRLVSRTVNRNQVLPIDKKDKLFASRKIFSQRHNNITEKKTKRERERCCVNIRLYFISAVEVPLGS